jgi:membrane-associated phospholipid phosphatase
MRFLVVGVVAVGLAFALDHWAYEHVVYARVYEQDWGRFLRVMGFWPTSAVAAIALYLHERGAVASAGRRALLLAGAPALSGITGELLKLLLRRERPEVHGGQNFFRAFSDRPFSTSGLALPSSHVIVAFGAAAMLAYLFPRARWVWFALATGCAVTRVLARAHFLSDTVAAALVAIATTAWLWRRLGAPPSPDYPN